MTFSALTNREFAYFAATGRGAHDAITTKLGWQPSIAWSEGDAKPHPQKGTRQFMKWRLNSGLPDTATLAQHIASLIATLELRSDRIRALVPDYQLSIVCVGSYPASSHGLRLEHAWLSTAAHLGLSFDLDFYFTSESEGSGNRDCPPSD